MAFELPPLQYDYSALEPHIDTQTMQIHHDKHHAAYVTNLNKALESASGLAGKTIDEILANLSAVPENVRQAVVEGRAEYMPIFLHEIEGLFESGERRLDYVLMQTSPPDKYGYMSLGVGVDCTLTAARNAFIARSWTFRKSAGVSQNSSRLPHTLSPTMKILATLTVFDASSAAATQRARSSSDSIDQKAGKMTR